jgi:hypothetical protein
VVGQVPADRVVAGPWLLGFPPDRGAPASVNLPDLIDWTDSEDPGVRYFSGTATYRNSFPLAAADLGKPGPVFLDLGRVKEVARVTVNGREAGVLWKEPYRIDIRPFVKSGDNLLEIAVTNTWNNRLVGDQREDAGERITRTNIAGKFSPRSPLLSSGLIGPVTLQFPIDATSSLTP